MPSAREKEHRLRVLGCAPAAVAKRIEGTEVTDFKPMVRCERLVELTRAAHQGELEPPAIAPFTKLHVCVELPVGGQPTVNQVEARINDLVGHVDQHGERPRDVDRSLEVHLREIRGVNQNRALIVEPCLAELAATLVENVLTRLDAHVMARREVIDQRYPAA